VSSPAVICTQFRPLIIGEWIRDTIAFLVVIASLGSSFNDITDCILKDKKKKTYDRLRPTRNKV